MIFDRVMPLKLTKKKKFVAQTNIQLCMAFAFLVYMLTIIIHVSACGNYCNAI